MDRRVFLQAQSWLSNSDDGQWPPALNRSTSEVIFKGFCGFLLPERSDESNRYLYFGLDAPHATDPAQLAVELALVHPKIPCSSDTTTDSTSLPLRASSLHALLDGVTYVVEHAAIEKIVFGDTDPKLPPSITVCFRDVHMQLFRQGPCDHQVVACELRAT